jgi:hypothetical protein
VKALGRRLESAAIAATSKIETDYLVVGAGALGMGFVDTLLDESDAEVVVIDRHSAPGGHWLDSYPFVRLHQPSMNYGVNSTPLGQDRVETTGRDAGFYERATGHEICAYYDEVMSHRFLPSGRVRFFPMCDYLGDGRFRCSLTGGETQVTVRRRIVNATYLSSRVPAVDPAPFQVTEGARCVPVGELARVPRSPAGYVIVGAGKTAMDATCWLIDQGVHPAEITWIRSRDPWILNRRFFQPGGGVVSTFEGVVLELEAVAEGRTVHEVLEVLEGHDVVFRIDRSVQPSISRGATSSLGELEQLRRVENVVRLGHVLSIGRDTIELEEGSIPTSERHLHVHCASAGLGDNAPRPIFTDETILLQPVTRVSLSLSASLLAFVEASERTTDEKNRLCRPNPWPHTPFDWIRHILTGMRTELGWQQAPDVVEWVELSRLNLIKGLDQADDKEMVGDLQTRFVQALFPALSNLDELSKDVTPAERARLFEATS